MLQQSSEAVQEYRHGGESMVTPPANCRPLEYLMYRMADLDGHTMVFVPGAPPRIRMRDGRMLDEDVAADLVTELARSLNLLSHDKAFDGFVSADFMQYVFSNGMPEVCCADFRADRQTSFPISIPDVGRFKVFVLYQRGSMSAIIKRTMPITTDDLSQVCRDLILKDAPGLHLVSGPSFDRNIDVVAKLTQFHADSLPDSICFVGAHVDYSLKHAAGLIVQREVGMGADVRSYEDAIDFAIRTGFSVLAVDTFSSSHIDWLMRAVDHNIKVITTFRAKTVEEAFKRLAAMLPRGYSVETTVQGVYLPDDRSAMGPGEFISRYAL